MEDPIELEFSPAHSLDYIFGTYFEEDQMRYPGIYIWGFKDSQENFVPYYVGKSQSNINERLWKHYLDLNYGNTYMIFHEEFYNALGTEEIQKKIKRCANPASKFPDLNNDMLYWNNQYFMSEKYDPKWNGVCFRKGMTTQGYELARHLRDGKDLSISKFIWKQFHKEKIYVTCCSIDREMIDKAENFGLLREKKRLTHGFEFFEDIIKYSLRFNVVSQSNDMRNPNAENYIRISCPQNLENIFNGDPYVEIGEPKNKLNIHVDPYFLRNSDGEIITKNTI
jgi:hypothetical protein